MKITINCGICHNCKVARPFQEMDNDKFNCIVCGEGNQNPTFKLVMDLEVHYYTEKGGPVCVL